jgi:glycerol-3-phosphate O-acyltransferase
MTFTSYCLDLRREEKKLELAVRAIDSNHAQAQASDIARALQADTFSLTYKGVNDSILAVLFRRLATSDFEHKECDVWKGHLCNGHPVVYAMGKRYYVRPLILDYLRNK